MSWSCCPHILHLHHHCWSLRSYCSLPFPIFLIFFCSLWDMRMAPNSLWWFCLWSLKPLLLSKPFLQNPCWWRLQICTDDLGVWASIHVHVLMLSMGSLSVSSVFFRRQTLEPVIQAHHVQFCSSSACFLYCSFLALQDVLPASANFHHVLPQGEILQPPTWPQILIKLLVCIHWGDSWALQEILTSWKNSFQGRLHLHIFLKLLLGFGWTLFGGQQISWNSGLDQGGPSYTEPVSPQTLLFPSGNLEYIQFHLPWESFVLFRQDLGQLLSFGCIQECRSHLGKQSGLPG